MLLLAPAAASAQGLKSDNVTVVGKLPDAIGAIGARFSPDGDTMYVTSATGLGIYDITTPESPQLLSRLPLPHFENEDVDVGRDTVVITNDPSFAGVGADLPDRRQRPERAGRSARCSDSRTFDTANGHIANCVNDCQYLYTTGTAEGLAIYDIRDLANPHFVKTFPLPGNGFTHDVNVDSRGITWVTGEDGTFGFDTTDPLNPQLLLRSDENVTNTGGGLPGDDGSGPLDFLHHNSLRITDDTLAVTEEDYLKPGCDGQGSLQTWQITDEHNSDGSQKLKMLDLWTTELNELASPGRPLAGDDQLLGALVRRVRRPAGAGLVRPGRPLPRRLAADRHPPGRLLRHQRHVLGRLLRADRSRARDRLRARRHQRRRRPADRPLQRAADGAQGREHHGSSTGPHGVRAARALGSRLSAALGGSRVRRLWGHGAEPLSGEPLSPMEGRAGPQSWGRGPVRSPSARAAA